MIATILTQSMPQSKDSVVSRNSNAAGAPLPLVPRRVHSTTHVGNVNVTVSRSSDSLNIISQRGIPASNVDSGSTEHRKGNRAENLVNFRWRGAGRNSITTALEQTRSVDIGSKVNCHPPVQVRLTPPQRGTDNTSVIRHIPNLDNRPSPPGHGQRLVRKKSGQLVKSSLKSSNSCSKGGLSIVTLGNYSKSEPTTPTLTKAVHFDPHLEHVKLFLAEQKPLAVSRDGSPTDDTSGTDNDFPSFIYGGEKKIFYLKINNMPPLLDKSGDIALEDLSLVSEGTSIIGRVRLRNIAYTKCLTVRFTFDGWLTISEVTGKYLETVDATFDRFAFMISLHDLLQRIEDKTLIFALRYAVAGREIWDNNKGRNYIVTFPQQTNSQSGANGDISHLRSKLERVQCGSDSPCQRNCCQDNRHSDNNNTLRASASLTSQYDIENSLRRPRAYQQRCYNQPLLDDTNRVPRLQPDNDIALVMPVPSLGSPRDLDADTFFPAARVTSCVDQILSSPNRPHRNHQRSYFDADREWFGVKRTPPGTPLEISPRGSTSRATACYRSSSSACDVVMVGDRSVSLKPEIHFSGSDDSTPQLVTPSTSRSSSPSPTKSETADVISTSELIPSPTMDYRQFLSRFCFFTGLDNVKATIPGTPSSGQISTGTYPRLR